MNPDKFKRVRSPHFRQWGLYKGLVLGVIPADHKNNSTGDRLEYVVKIRGQIYFNVIAVCDLGGIYNYSETIKKGTEDILDESQYDEKRDGETVLVGFVGGHGDLPLIIGSLEHPTHGGYKKSSEANGRQHIFEYNGIEYKIDQNGTLTFEQIGLKEIQGAFRQPTITNPDAVGAKISIDGTNGNIDIITPSGGQINIDGATGDTAINLGVAGKVAIGNEAEELLSILSEALDFIVNTITFSNAGGPTGPPTNASVLDAIKIRLDDALKV